MPEPPAYRVAFDPFIPEVLLRLARTDMVVCAFVNMMRAGRPWGPDIALEMIEHLARNNARLQEVAMRLMSVLPMQPVIKNPPE